MGGRPEPAPESWVTDVVDQQFEALLDRARAADEMAFRRLYREFNPPLVRFLRARAEGVADDLASDVWTTAATSLDAFRGGRREWNAWLFTLAHRRLVDHQRRESRRRTVPEPPNSFLGIAAGDDPASRTVDAMSAQAAIDDVVASLSPEQAEVVLLRVVAGLEVSDVARIMARSDGWVRVNQHRALRRLVGRFGDGGSGVAPLVDRVAR